MLYADDAGVHWVEVPKTQSFGAQAAIALDSALSERGQSRKQLAQVQTCSG